MIEWPMPCRVIIGRRCVLVASSAHAYRVRGLSRPPGRFHSQYAHRPTTPSMASPTGFTWCGSYEGSQQAHCPPRVQPATHPVVVVSRLPSPSVVAATAAAAVVWWQVANKRGGCQQEQRKGSTHPTTPPRTAVTAVAKLALVVCLHAQRRGAGSTRGRRLLGAARAGGGGTAGDAPALGPPGRSGHHLDACARHRRHGRDWIDKGNRVSELRLGMPFVFRRAPLHHLGRNA
jgi:hypothetical protein